MFLPSMVTEAAPGSLSKYIWFSGDLQVSMNRSVAMSHELVCGSSGRDLDGEGSIPGGAAKPHFPTLWLQLPHCANPAPGHIRHSCGKRVFFFFFSWSCRQVGPVCIARDLRLGFFSNSHGQNSS